MDSNRVNVMMREREEISVHKKSSNKSNEFQLQVIDLTIIYNRSRVRKFIAREIMRKSILSNIDQDLIITSTLLIQYEDIQSYFLKSIFVNPRSFYGIIKKNYLRTLS